MDRVQMSAEVYSRCLHQSSLLAVEPSNRSGQGKESMTAKVLAWALRPWELELLFLEWLFLSGCQLQWASTSRSLWLLE